MPKRDLSTGMDRMLKRTEPDAEDEIHTQRAAEDRIARPDTPDVKMTVVTTESTREELESLVKMIRKNGGTIPKRLSAVSRVALEWFLDCIQDVSIQAVESEEDLLRRLKERYKK